jgi:hypothetical protein
MQRRWFDPVSLSHWFSVGCPTRQPLILVLSNQIYLVLTAQPGSLPCMMLWAHTYWTGSSVCRSFCSWQVLLSCCSYVYNWLYHDSSTAWVIRFFWVLWLHCWGGCQYCKASCHAATYSLLIWLLSFPEWIHSLMSEVFSCWITVESTIPIPCKKYSMMQVLCCYISLRTPLISVQ